MVADRHPLVVGQQRVVGPEQLADVRRVVDAGVEVGVVADARRARPSRRRACGDERRAATRACCAGPARSAFADALRAARRRCADGSCISAFMSVVVERARRALQVEHAGRRSPRRGANAVGAAPSRRKRPSGRFWIGKSALPALADSTQLRSAGSCVVGCGGDHALNSRWCRKSACCGARLVFDHSSSMSHFTVSSLAIIASSSGSGQASSTRWPLGSKK